MKRVVKTEEMGSFDASVRRGHGVSQCGSFPGGGGRGWACTPRVRGRRAARVRAAAAARVGDGGCNGAYSERALDVAWD